MYTSFGDRILLLRKKKKLTQEQLAQKIGIPVKELADYEGDAAFPPFNIAVKIADVLDISLDFLACRIDEQPNMKWIKWAGDIDSLSDRTKEVLYAAVDALINYDKVKNIYKS
ncbi:MAG TPA: helix-turn-helix transcriptional regulator [Bacteroidales bacterium]|nr:helix-turn-helix transcriptional regulator [Bacteroidales bacterium]